MKTLGRETEVLHVGAPLPLVEGLLGVGDGLPGVGREELEAKSVLGRPGKAVFARLRHQLFVVAVEFPDLERFPDCEEFSAGN